MIKLKDISHNFTLEDCAIENNCITFCINNTNINDSYSISDSINNEDAFEFYSTKYKSITNSTMQCKNESISHLRIKVKRKIII